MEAFIHISVYLGADIHRLGASLFPGAVVSQLIRKQLRGKLGWARDCVTLVR